MSDTELIKNVKYMLTHGYSTEDIINRVREHDAPDHDIEKTAAYRLGKHEAKLEKDNAN